MNQVSQVDQAARPMRRAFFADDGGFSTPAMALALLLSVSLVFASAQVYRIQSACAEVQNVADAAALSAQNQVASFYVVAQVCDCVSLTMSLAGTVCLGAGVVALCVPVAQGAGEKLIDAGRRMLEARDRFVRSATAGLGQLQRLLPIIAAAQAAGVAAANGTSSGGYVGIAVLAPLEGRDIATPNTQEQAEAVRQVLDQQDGIAQAARESEAAAEAANEHKQRAFIADCGATPGYCMQERAASLAGMQGSENPSYQSVDAWSFGVALLRARAYYAHRLAQEAPLDSSVEEGAASALRTRFYAYARDQLQQGYVHETADSFDAYFPLLPRNTDQMRQTDLYTENAYPVVQSPEDEVVMHAWEGCPQVGEGTLLGFGSVAQAEAEGMPVCPECGFSPSRLGKVASASTSIANGFEHHYLVVAQEAEAYSRERAKLDSQAQQVKQPVSGLLATLGSLVKSASTSRIEVAPPGRVGAVAIVVAPGGADVGSLVPTSFVSDAGALGARVAVSGATLAQDDPTGTANVISSLADSLASSAPGIGALPQAASHAWGAALGAYVQGHDSLLATVRQALDSLPLVGRTGLGSWAAGKLEHAIADAGYAPPQLAAYKPVTVNSYHVASLDDGEASQALVQAKQAWLGRLGHDGGSALAAAAGVAGGLAVQRIEDAQEGLVVARIQLLGDDGPSLDIRLALPPAVGESLALGAASLVESAVQAIGSLAASTGAERRWE